MRDSPQAVKKDNKSIHSNDSGEACQESIILAEEVEKETEYDMNDEELIIKG